jgi:integrase
MSLNCSQHTLGSIDCPVCAEAAGMHESELSPQMSFAEAFGIWIGQRVIEHAGMWINARYISPRTERDLRQYARAAGKFFGSMRLEEIGAARLREYQRARATRDLSCGAWDKAAGANLIRKEVQTVIRVMRAAGAWTDKLDQSVQMVQRVDNDVRRAMTPEEQHRWLHVAASQDRWSLVYCWSLIALQTTAATNEMRSLRLSDIYLDQGTMQIRNEGAKNKFRVRTIPLETPQVIWALGRLMERARSMGANGPQCYLFPIHVAGDQYDPLRPMTVWGLRKRWDEVRAAAELPWLTVYDLRHAAITRMAEAGVPIQVIMSFAGHISPRMQQHYTAISMEAKRRWAAAAWGGAQQPFAVPVSWGTTSAVPQSPRFGPQPETGFNAQPRNGIGVAPVAAGW